MSRRRVKILKAQYNLLMVSLALSLPSFPSTLCTHWTSVLMLEKQQAEYTEALNSLRKKADKLIEENIRLQQLNVTLSAEVEDCRSQIKHLLLETCVRVRERCVCPSSR